MGNKKKTNISKKILKKGNIGRPVITPEKDAKIKYLITQEARSLLLEHGYRAISIRTIMKNIGYSPMMFYRFFETKRFMLHSIMEDIFIEFLRNIQPFIISNSKNINQLNILLSEIVEFWLKNPDKYKIVFLNIDEPEDQGDSEYFTESQIIQTILNEIDKMLVQYRKYNLFKENFSNNDILNSMIVMILGICHSLIILPEFPWGSEKELRENSIKIWCSGILNS